MLSGTIYKLRPYMPNKPGDGKVYRVREDVTVSELKEHIEKLFHAIKPIAEATKHNLSNSKKDCDRDRIIRELDVVLTMFNTPGEIRPISEDINEVIRQWAAECGLNNRWVKALKGFADAGGNVRWYEGFPHPGRQPDLEIYDKFWALIERRVTLTVLKENTRRLLGISRVVNY
jgi:hypothetical protein